MSQILLVEDAKFFRTVLKAQIENHFGYSVTAVASFAEAVAEITEHKDKYELALLDLNLPDAPNGEIVDLVTRVHIPSLIFSGSFEEEVRDYLEQPYIIDYVVKDSPASISNVINTVNRFFKNKKHKALVIDDSKFARLQMTTLLRQFNFDVIEATNGREALKAIDEHDDIRLVFCDYNLPDMLGVDICKRIRAKKGRDQLCIIGVSAYGTHAISAQFLKAGASDFLVKPFLIEEFYCRVTLNMDALDKVHELDELVYTDLVTQLKNRRFLNEKYDSICERTQKLDQFLVCCMMELNDFKSFNTSYGPEAGDAILYIIARELEEIQGGDITIVRYSGSQFCLLANTNEPDQVIHQFQEKHRQITSSVHPFQGKDLSAKITAISAKADPEEAPELLKLTAKGLHNALNNSVGKFLIAS